MQTAAWFGRFEFLLGSVYKKWKYVALCLVLFTLKQLDKLILSKLGRLDTQDFLMSLSSFVGIIFM